MKEFYRSKIKDLLRPGYYFCKDICDFQGRKRLKKNIILNDSYLGKKVFLLLTGESLQQVNINKLKDEYTFGTGFVFLHKNIGKINLTFYMNPEPSKSFNPNNPNWPKSHLGPLGHDGVVAFYKAIDERLGNKTILILNSDNYKYIKNNKLFKDKIKYFVKGKKYLHVIEGVPYKIIAGLTKRSISGGGSVFFSILIMMYMGFKEIYLCGAGYTYEPVYNLHFYDNFVFPKSMGREKAEIEARKAIDNINKKYFSSLEYYGFFEKDDLYRSICVIRKDQDSNKDKHRILNNYARSQGVKIYNIVPDGFESPIYEKITWQEVESKILPGNQKSGIL
ncbi:MAG: hypothetical protein JRE47_12455 [Deltaproteobacteria bacterium]|nr:hypothetical protein [Deltaproteobacteria bacterium]MBW2737273.1 hypothetical protein [Deltaproteobacteria bacterium]